MRAKGVVEGTTTIYVGEHYEVQGTTGKRYYLFNGRPVAVEVGSGSNASLYYLLTDHLGSTSLVLDVGGAVVGELRYKAWGETRLLTGTVPTSLRYTGQRQEAALGIYYYRARWYDPALGRFLQPDTIVPELGNPQALNRYSYVLNNPLRYNDPSGHCPWCIGAAVGALVGAAVGAAAVAVPQMIQNVRDGQPLMANIDPGEVGKAAVAGAVAGAVVGGTLGWGASALGLVGAGEGGTALVSSATVVEAGATAEAVATAACADGDCTNEVVAAEETVASALESLSAESNLLEAESWQEAERAVGKLLGWAKNTTKYFVEGMSRPRIPDFISDEAIYEVKWYGASKLTMSSQLRDMAILARTKGIPFNIVVRQGTYVTDSVYELVESTGGQILRWFK